MSREHARIELLGEDLILFDCKSNFGTLVKEKRLTLELSKQSKVVQVGRTIIFFQIVL